MRVWVKHVDSYPTRSGKKRWSVYVQEHARSLRADFSAYTWNDWEASVCERARHLNQQVDLELSDDKVFGHRIQSVSLVSLTPREQNV